MKAHRRFKRYKICTESVMYYVKLPGRSWTMNAYRAYI